MNSLINSFAVCPAIKASSSASTSASADILTSSAFNAFKQLFNPIDLLCFLFFLSTAIAFILYAIEFKGLMAANSKHSSTSYLIESESHHKLDSEILMNNINNARQNKRPSIDSSVEEEVKVKSPKLVCIESNHVEEPQLKIKPRRNSLPKSPFKTIELDVKVKDCKVPLSPNHECITLIEDDNDDNAEVIIEDNNSITEASGQKEQQKQKEGEKFDWYLRFDLPDDELATLSYAQKSRRFYHLTNLGEVKQQIKRSDIQEPVINLEKKPFEWYLRWDVPADELECLSYAEKSARFCYLTDYGEVRRQHQPTPKPPEEEVVVQVTKKPTNLITDLVANANSINVPEYMMLLLKQNHQLTSLLKRTGLRREDYCMTSMMRGRINYSMLMAAGKYYMKPAMIKYSPVVKKPEIHDKVRWGKPLTKEQLRNILFIIG